MGRLTRAAQLARASNALTRALEARADAALEATVTVVGEWWILSGRVAAPSAADLDRWYAAGDAAPPQSHSRRDVGPSSHIR